ncbi:MAG: isoprenylcysteine carboxylmethyltransferase family protein, partial [Myxococcales bacterium]|nr:isoprenylcysteine carboxylmethyltransferase family protein [Myxococcales bacterium]
VDERERTALVTSGPFAFVRNPIFTFMGVSQAGFALLVPNAVGLGALALLAVGIELHVRFVEEPYLLRTHGDAYARYAASTGRFLPGIGRALAARSDDRAA